jgi:hypothetical protein
MHYMKSPRYFPSEMRVILYSRISAVTGIPRSTVILLIKKHAADHCARLKAPNRRGKDK